VVTYSGGAAPPLLLTAITLLSMLMFVPPVVYRATLCGRGGNPIGIDAVMRDV